MPLPVIAIGGISLENIGSVAANGAACAAVVSAVVCAKDMTLATSELVKEFHNSDVLIFPSLVEGFGQVILEAMSSGLPVICTPNTAGRDLFTSGKEGMIVPIRDIDVLIAKIEWCRNNKVELGDMGREAARTARIFTWNKFRASIVDFYRSKTADSTMVGNTPAKKTNLLRKRID